MEGGANYLETVFKREISRRQATQFPLRLFAAAAATKILPPPESPHRSFFSDIQQLLSVINKLPYYDVKRLYTHEITEEEFKTPEELRGVAWNIPFLPESEPDSDTVTHALQTLKEVSKHIGTQPQIRVFTHYHRHQFITDYEKDLYDDTVLEHIKSLGAKGVRMRVSLFDGFIFRQEVTNYAYTPPSDVRSPFLDHAEGKSLLEKQRYFFTNQDMKQHFLNMIKYQVMTLKDCLNIVAWDLNEIDPPVAISSNPELFEDFNSWFEEVVKTIHDIDPTRPIIAGVANPNWIDEKRQREAGLTANSINLYPQPDRLTDLIEYKQRNNRALPLVVNEIGFPDKLHDIPIPGYEWGYEKFVNFCLYELFDVDDDEKKIRPWTKSIALWRLFTDMKHQDNYAVYPKRVEQLLHIISRWNNIINPPTG